MASTAVFLWAVVVLECMGLFWVVVLKKAYQWHERRAYGFPTYNPPLWAKGYWGLIGVLLALSLVEIHNNPRAPVIPTMVVLVMAISLSVKAVIYALLPDLRDKLVTAPWPKIAISKALVAAMGIVGICNL